jgi:HSP20 family protein
LHRRIIFLISNFFFLCPQVHVDNGMLTLSGERRIEKTRDDERFHRVERSYGRFSRSFALPAECKPEQVSASCADGVLTVTVPKSAKAPATKVEVK